MTGRLPKAVSTRINSNRKDEEGTLQRIRKLQALMNNSEATTKRLPLVLVKFGRLLRQRCHSSGATYSVRGPAETISPCVALCSRCSHHMQSHRRKNRYKCTIGADGRATNHLKFYLNCLTSSKDRGVKCAVLSC